jgi:ATP-binding cassette subfamily B protein
MAAVLLLKQVLGSVLEWIKTAQSENIEDHIKRLVHHKAAEVDLGFYERPDAYDKLSRATGKASSKSLSLLNNIGGIIQNVVTLFAVAGILFTYGAWLPVLLFISTVPALWVIVHHNLLEHEWWSETTEERRWVDYFDRIQTLPFYAGEVRALDLNDHFRDSYQTLRKKLREEKIELLRNKSLARFFAGIAALLVMGGAIGWMSIRALQGLATLGDVALFYQAFNQGQGFMRSLLSSIGSLYTDGRYLEHLFGFLDQPTHVTSPERAVPVSGVQDKIAFRNVDFKYPRSSELALEDFSLEIEAGQTVAVVGPNGAGKSTFTKLLCRFYDPLNGRIEVDGVDLRELDLEAHRRRIAVMFQQPIKYMATVGENIEMGDIHTPMDPARRQQAAEGAKATPIVEKMDDGYDTLLGKHFEGGEELSGGEWQRLALARAFYRDAPIVILDEPTSHMDSWAEADWLDRFYRFVESKTALVITHRFTTAKRADIIHVMYEGRIVEAGSHEELLARDGHYAQSWRAQVNEKATTSRIEAFGG